MGIYYMAIDWESKEVINPPDGFANKSPGIFHPHNPFSHMVAMKNVYGYNFIIENDGEPERVYDPELKDISEETYQELLEKFPGSKEFYENKWNQVK